MVDNMTGEVPREDSRSARGQGQHRDQQHFRGRWSAEVPEVKVSIEASSISEGGGQQKCPRSRSA
jgi:hypothetical protein